MRINNLFFLLILFIFSVSGCKSSIKKQEKIILKEHENMLLNSNNDSIFYAYNNIIIYNNQKIFWQDSKSLSIHPMYKCGTGLDRSKPPFLDFKPANLHPLLAKNLEKYILINRFQENQTDSISICFASNTPFITGEISDAILKLKQNHPRFKILFRTITEEQFFVAKAKINKLSYDAKKQNWKVNFNDSQIPSLEETIKFIDP